MRRKRHCYLERDTFYDAYHEKDLASVTRQLLPNTESSDDAGKTLRIFVHHRDFIMTWIILLGH